MNKLSNRVIFLDVDGVLNDIITSSIGNDWEPPSDFHLALLKRLVDLTKASLVLTSSWRDCDYALSLLTQHLANWRLTIADQTPVINFNRPNEIKEWLKKHIEVEQFVILDDDAYPFDAELTPHLVKTSIMYGLLPQHIEQAITILNDRR